MRLPIERYQTRLAAGPTLPREIDRIVKDAVADAIEEVEDSYEAYHTKIIEPGGRGFRFGSGSDGGYGGETYTTMDVMSGSGRWPNNRKLSQPLFKGEEKLFQDAQKSWMENNRDFMEANDLKPNQVNYNDLNELGFEDEAEEFDEIVRNWMSEGEDITFRLGAFYYGPDNRKEGRPGEQNMYVFALMDCEGHYLPQQPIDTFEMTFAFDDPRDLKRKLEAALKKAVDSLE
jgi:hypothetical protein